MGLPVNFFKYVFARIDWEKCESRNGWLYWWIARKTIQAIEEAKIKTADNTGLTLIFAINYGGRAEIVHGIQTLMKEMRHASDQDIDALTEQHFQKYLMTRDYPDPELLIRTSGEQRVSNFLIWQLSYSEFIFNSKMWPDFDEEELKACIKTYQSRQKKIWRIVDRSSGMKVRTITTIVALIVLPILLIGGSTWMYFTFYLH